MLQYLTGADYMFVISALIQNMFAMGGLTTSFPNRSTAVSTVLIGRGNGPPHLHQSWKMASPPAHTRPAWALFRTGHATGTSRQGVQKLNSTFNKS